jgi:hypothetical protein
MRDMLRTITLPNGNELELKDPEVFELPSGEKYRLPSAEQETLLKAGFLEGIGPGEDEHEVSRLKQKRMLDRETGAPTPDGEHVRTVLLKRGRKVVRA